MHRRTDALVLLGLALAVCARNDPPAAAGSADGPCYANGTCDAGLVCTPERRCTDAAVLVCASVTCSGHGRCALEEGLPACVCDAGYRAVGLTCLDLSGCTPAPRALAACDSGDVWWFDGCGTRQERFQDCAGTGCVGSVCTEALTGMVLIDDFPGGPFWIDRYEASLFGPGVLGDMDQDADDDGKIADPVVAATHARSHGLAVDDDGGESGVTLTTRAATSAAGVLPATYVTWYQAASACTRAGKRLCTTGEFQWACQGGTAFNTYPYGMVFDGGDEPGTDCWSTNMASLVIQLTGVTTGCVTANGIHDLSGNVAEWAGYRDPTVADANGGDIGETGTNVACGEIVDYTTAQTAGWLGFRCCASP
jgi:hypothetical protein